MTRKIKTYYTFWCVKCGSIAIKVPAIGYWRTVKEWICDECKGDKL